jgi:hypothetical protein
MRHLHFLIEVPTRLTPVSYGSRNPERIWPVEKQDATEDYYGEENEESSNDISE